MLVAMPTTTPAAPPEVASSHFLARLAVETDAADVASAMAAGSAQFTLLDVRSPEAFAAAHLPGATSLPAGDIDDETVASLPDGLLVVYCWGPGCNGAHKAAARLAARGRRVKEMIGGFEYWVREGFAAEGRHSAGLSPDDGGLVCLRPQRTSASMGQV